MRLPRRVGRPARGPGQGSGPRGRAQRTLEVWGPTWGPWGRVQSAGAGCPFRLAPVHHPATSQLWQPGDPHPDHWAWTWSLPSLGSACPGLCSRPRELWGWVVGPPAPLGGSLGLRPPPRGDPPRAPLPSSPRSPAPPPPSPAAWGPLPCLRAEHPQAATGWGWGPLGAQAAPRSLRAPPSFLLSLLLGTTCLERFMVGF